MVGGEGGNHATQRTTHLRQRGVHPVPGGAGGAGTAYALGMNTVGSPQIIDDSVRIRDLANGSVTNPKLGRNAVTGGKGKNGSTRLTRERPSPKRFASIDRSGRP